MYILTTDLSDKILILSLTRVVLGEKGYIQNLQLQKRLKIEFFVIYL